MTYLSLIYEFFKAGLFAVGGGLATIPFLKAIAENYDWFTTAQLTDMIGVSEATPGPIGVNMATYAGFSAAGVFGGLIATLALVAPSVVVVCIISRFLTKFRDSVLVKRAFYGLRPASAGLIAGAMFSVLFASVFSMDAFAAGGDILGNVKFLSLGLYALFTITAFMFKKIHPIIFILGGAAVGIIFGL